MARRRAEMQQMKLKRLAGYIAFAIFFMVIGHFGPEFLTYSRIDTCLDGGGAWNYQAERCTFQ